MGESNRFSYTSKRSKSPRELIDPAVAEFFDQYKEGEVIPINNILKGIEDLGLDLAFDPRLMEVKEFLASKEKLELQELTGFFQLSDDLLYDALVHSLAIPHIQKFRKSLGVMFDSCQLEILGKVSQETPYLSKQDPEVWALSVISVSGQVINFGSTRSRFVIHRCSGPVLFALGVNLLGIGKVRSILGTDFDFRENVQVLNKKGVPANSATDAGAMCLASWIRNVGLEDKTDSEVFDYFDGFIKDLCGGRYVRFCISAYMSAKEHNRSKGTMYYLKSQKCLPERSNPEKDFDFYLTTGSYEMDCESLAMLGATLANYGSNVFTTEQVVSREVCRNTLAMMGVCAPHRRWPFLYSIPACGGASGCLLVVFPCTMALVVFSPKLDEANCSVKGFKFMNVLSRAFYLNRYEIISKDDWEGIPRVRLSDPCPSLCWLYHTATTNDVFPIVNIVSSETSICKVNYFGRTVLHDAAAAGNIQGVKLLITYCPRLLEIKDKMGFTPMDDAIFFKHTEVEDYFNKWYILKTGKPYQREETNGENKPDV